MVVPSSQADEERTSVPSPIHNGARGIFEISQPKEQPAFKVTQAATEVMVVQTMSEVIPSSQPELDNPTYAGGQAMTTLGPTCLTSGFEDVAAESCLVHPESPLLLAKPDSLDSTLVDQTTTCKRALSAPLSDSSPIDRNSKRPRIDDMLARVQNNSAASPVDLSACDQSNPYHDDVSPSNYESPIDGFDHVSGAAPCGSNYSRLTPPTPFQDDAAFISSDNSRNGGGKTLQKRPLTPTRNATAHQSSSDESVHMEFGPSRSLNLAPRGRASKLAHTSLRGGHRK
jgi:hypothetical protein